MKKFMLILAALAVSTSVVLTGCGKDNTEKPAENPAEENNQEQTNEENAGENVTFDGTVTEFNEFIENAVAQVSGTTDIDKEVLGTIGEVPVSAAALRYGTMMGESYLAYGLSQEEVDELVLNICKQNAGLITFAYENGITISEDEIKATVEATLSNLEAQYGDTLDSALAESPYTKHYYCLYSVYSALYSKVSEAYLSDANSEFVQSCLDEAIEFFTKDDALLRAKHILIQFPEGENEDGSLTDEQKAATLEKANEVLAEVNAMTDISEFDALIEKYNEDPGVQSNPNGYFFEAGEMVPEFENATRELEIGKTSGLVETSYGYHIILRLPVEKESFNGSDKHLSFASDKLLTLIDDTVAEDEFVPAENYDARIQEFKDEYNTTFGAAPEADTGADAEGEEAPEAEEEVTEEAVEEETAE